VARPARSREPLLDAAEELFLARGYDGTQLDLVCERAGVSRGGLFYHFDSKEALAEAAVQRFFDGLLSEAQEALSKAGPSTASERLFAYVDVVADMTKRSRLARGCLLGTITIECSQTNPSLAAIAEDGFTQWRRGLAALIEEAAAERGLDIDATGVSTAFLAAVEGGLLLDRRGGRARAVDAAIAHFRHYLGCLLELPKEGSP
jgi:TetR/AcrR family transcriptional regulator, transcriptional repressor for nem operon